MPLGYQTGFLPGMFEWGGGGGEGKKIRVKFLCFKWPILTDMTPKYGIFILSAKSPPPAETLPKVIILNRYH